MQFISPLVVFLIDETALLLTILFNYVLVAMYLSYQVLTCDKKSLWLYLPQAMPLPYILYITEAKRVIVHFHTTRHINVILTF